MTVTTLPVRAKLLYSFFIATGEESYLEDLRGLIPEAIEQSMIEDSFWSLFTGSYDAETDETVEPAKWLAKSCNDIAPAFAFFAERPDPNNPSRRNEVIWAFDDVTSGCNDIARQDGAALSADTVQIMASAAATLFDLRLNSYYSAQLAPLIAPGNLFAAKVIAARAWAENGFRSDVTYKLLNVLDFSDPKPGEVVNGDPDPVYWREFLAEHGHFAGLFQSLPYDEWPTEPPN